MIPLGPEDGPIQCPQCTGPLEEILVMRGGREVLNREVHFSDDEFGVASYERCRDCGFRPLDN